MMFGPNGPNFTFIVGRHEAASEELCVFSPLSGHVLCKKRSQGFVVDTYCVMCRIYLISVL